jgi:hypothetical protein
MTISRGGQLENVQLVLDLLLSQVADHPICAAFFDPKSPQFSKVLRTTWKESCDQGWVEELELYGQQHYRLAGRGWIAALSRGLTGRRHLQDAAGLLSAGLKRHVKGRHQDMSVELSTIASESGLSASWVFNAIESNLLEVLHRRCGARWGDRGTLILIPLNFGIEIIDHSGDLRVELEEVQEESF